MVLQDEQRSNLIAALGRMGLLREGESPLLTPLTGGVSSLIVRADTERGSICVKQALAQLRVAAEWKAPLERNQAEAAYLQLAWKIVPGHVPRLLAEDAQGSTFAMELFDPDAYPVWKSQLRDGLIDPGVAREVGRILVRIHGATANSARVARVFAHDDSFRALRLDPYFAAAAARHPDCAPALEHLIEVTASTKRALVHGDPSPKNVLVGPHGPVLLDAECAWFGDPAFDLAFALHHLLLKCVWRPEHLAAYLGCFAVLSQSYLSAVRWEPAEAIEARAAICVAGLLLARVDGKSPAEYLTEEADRARVRGFARRFLLHPSAALQPVSDAWRAEISNR